MFRQWIQKSGCFILFLLAMPLAAQFSQSRFNRREDLLRYKFDIISSKAQEEGKNKLNFMLKVPFDDLQFVHEDSLFVAEYELTVSIQTLKKEHVESSISKKKVIVNDFKQTNSNRYYSFVEAEFIIDPGEYTIYIQFMDLDSKKVKSRKGKISLTNYSQLDFGISDPLLLDKVGEDSLGNSLYLPNVVWNFSKNNESIYLQYEIYNSMNLEKVPVTYEILNMDKSVVKTETFEKMLTGKVTYHFIEIKKDSMSSGRYHFKLIVGKDELVADKENLLTVEWAGMPLGAKSMDSAIEQLRYIANGKFIRRLRKADEKEKVSLFNKYWKSRDPSPESDINELKDEYYHRIEFANMNFKESRDGWDTDRGMVYVILGPPDDIDRHPFESGYKPYEVWNYNRFARSLFFMDYNGFGEYRLMPDSWDVFGQMR